MTTEEVIIESLKRDWEVIIFAQQNAIFPGVCEIRGPQNALVRRYIHTHHPSDLKLALGQCFSQMLNHIESLKGENI